MYRITKLALVAGVAGLILFVLGPPMLRSETDKRDRVAGGVKVLAATFVKVQQDEANAILWVRRRYQRGNRVVLDGNRDYESKLAVDDLKSPVPVPVKVGSRFDFQYRHSRFQYRVTNINAKGVDIEVGGDSSALFFRNQTISLLWK